MSPLLLGFSIIVNEHDLAKRSSTKTNIKSLLNKMVYMEGGTFIMGIFPDSRIRMTESDSTLFSPDMPKRTNVDPYYISATEVTNGEWREFYQDKVIDLGEVTAKRKYFPDTSLWVTEFPYSYNKPMAEHYFSSPKFNDYPVVGITWDQANEYCLWKSDKLKALLDKKGIQSSIKFRLPTEIEWEYAAIKKEKKTKYTNNSAYPWSEENGFGQINDLTNIGQVHDINKVILKQYDDDGCLYTCKVASYPPNNKGMYDMGGNVSEWTNDQGYVSIHDFKNEVHKKLESLSEIENEIQKLQKKLDARDKVEQMFLEWLTHDRIVFRNNNLKVCKGGSWANGMIYTKTASRQGINKDSPSSKLGFRIAISNVNQDVVKYFPKKNWKPRK